MQYLHLLDFLAETFRCHVLFGPRFQAKILHSEVNLIIYYSAKSGWAKYQHQDMRILGTVETEQSSGTACNAFHIDLWRSLLANIKSCLSNPCNKVDT